MASQKSRRRKKREAKGLHQQPPPPKRTTLNLGEPDRLAEVGGIIRNVTDPVLEGERWARGVLLESYYNENKRRRIISSPWLTVYDQIGEQIAGMIDQPICLRGQVVGLPELDRRTQRSWHIAVQEVLCVGRTNMHGAGRFARNLIEVSGFMESRKSGVVVTSREPKCDFVVRCKAADGTEHFIDMTAYDLVKNKVEAWPIRRKLHVVANLCTYKPVRRLPQEPEKRPVSRTGKHTIMSIVPVFVERAADGAIAA